ncbi:TPA: glycerate kinase, partial [Pseudomonas aeruginosa]|nr:glycerate kinase [Pseudomonas aeruginosa]HBP3044423.1 glycerate kinase [Pseudomonas aeruginosa]
DAGAGLLGALGVRFLAADGEELAPGGAALAGLHSLDLGGLDPRLVDVAVEVAADVDNPLCGPRGASAVFGPQKGASAEQVAQLDAALAHFAKVVAATLGEDFSRVPGVGAAGGLGFAARAFLRARFRPGIELVAELAGLADALVGADLVLTGEGRLDAQSLHGKTPVGVARIARQAGVPVVALAGSLGDGYQRLHDAGIDAAFSLAPGPISLEQACAGAAAELEARAEQIARLWRLAQASREG